MTELNEKMTGSRSKANEEPIREWREEDVRPPNSGMVDASDESDNGGCFDDDNSEQEDNGTVPEKTTGENKNEENKNEENILTETLEVEEEKEEDELDDSVSIDEEDDSSVGDQQDIDKNVRFSHSARQLGNGSSRPRKSQPPPIVPSALFHHQYQSKGRHIDIATGMRTTRHQKIYPVTGDEQQAQDYLHHFQNRHPFLCCLIPRWFFSKPETKIENEDAEMNTSTHSFSFNYPEVQQYRIHSVSHDKEGWRIKHVTIGDRWSTWLSEYIRWTFRASFTQVFLMSFAVFMSLSCFFALFIYWIGQKQPDCILVNGADFVEAGTTYADAFHLSWTTFSTVGYGAISPKVSTIPPTKRCIGINMLMAFEAFCGVCFASVTSAKLFNKVARIQSIAEVIFSHPMCVRYGSGVSSEHNTEEPEHEHDDDNDHAVPDSHGLPCPILEFRIVNELANEKGGEIMNASVNVVASTLAAKAEVEKSIRGTARKSNRNGKKVGKGVQKTGAALFDAGRKATGSIIQRLNYHISRSGRSSSRDQEGVPYSEKELEMELEKELEARLNEKLESTAEMVEDMLEEERHVVVDEGYGSLAPRRIYHPLKIETDSHPFFMRVWNIRHVLDETSPLLSPKARLLIANNNGHWPEELNDYSYIRQHLKFHKVIVSFSGTGEGCGRSVYAQKVYDFCDANIGYSFANMLALSDEGRLVVDHELINDVREQNGGGAEPLSNILEDQLSPAMYATQMAAAAAVHATEATKLATEGMKKAVVNSGRTFYNRAGEVSSNVDIPEEVPEKLDVEIDVEQGDSETPNGNKRDQ